MQAAPAPSKGALKCPPRQGHSADPADRDLEFSGQGLQVVSRSERYLPATQAALVKNKKNHMLIESKQESVRNVHLGMLILTNWCLRQVLALPCSQANTHTLLFSHILHHQML